MRFFIIMLIAAYAISQSPQLYAAATHDFAAAHSILVQSRLCAKLVELQNTSTSELVRQLEPANRICSP